MSDCVKEMKLFMTKIIYAPFATFINTNRRE